MMMTLKKKNLKKNLNELLSIMWKKVLSGMPKVNMIQKSGMLGNGLTRGVMMESPRNTHLVPICSRTIIARGANHVCSHTIFNYLAVGFVKTSPSSHLTKLGENDSYSSFPQ